MSNRLAELSSKGVAALFLALTCSLGCGCLAADDGAEADDHAAYDEPGTDDVAAGVDDTAVDAVDEMSLGAELAALEAQFQRGQLQEGLDETQPNALTAGDGDGDGDGDEDGRSSNPEPTPWEPGEEDNPEPTPWHGHGDVTNPEPTPWLVDDDDDDDFATDAAFTADSSSGSGWGHGND